jgi:ankyrin repeat protein
VRIRATDVTPVLIAAGADAAIPTGGLPLIYTPIVYEDTMTAALLLEHGADVNARDMHGRTTLDHAIRLEKKRAIIRSLESRGAVRGDTSQVRARPTR